MSGTGSEEYGGESEEKKEEKAGSSDAYSTDPKTGETVYTDPVSGVEYVLNADKTGWISKSGGYEIVGSHYFYKDPESGLKQRWNPEKSEWEKVEDDGAKPEDQEDSESEEDDNTTDEDRKKRMLRKRKAQPGWGSQGSYEKDPGTGAQLYRDSKDGTLYEWDEEKKAWFPRIDQDFMASYQMNYGFDENGRSNPTRPDPEPDPEIALKKLQEEKERKEKEKNKKPEWFQDDETKSTKVYISGLPLDFTEEKLLELVQKCGVVDIDVRTNKPKLKLYKDSNGELKGDALCTYVKPESVQLALTILDGSRIGDCKIPISVERAKFEMKGEKYDPKLKPRKLTKADQERAKKKREKLLAWEPDKMRGERSKREKVVVIENVFDKKKFDVDPSLILETSSLLRDHCNKFGFVKKVVLYDKREDGICQVFFSSPEEADMAISMLDNRLFGDKRVLKAYTWDGKTKYKVTETAEEEKERLANWDKFLET